MRSVNNNKAPACAPVPAPVQLSRASHTLASCNRVKKEVISLRQEVAHLSAAAPRLASLGHTRASHVAQERALSAGEKLASLCASSDVPNVSIVSHVRRSQQLVLGCPRSSQFTPHHSVTRALAGMNQSVLAHVGARPRAMEARRMRATRVRHRRSAARVPSSAL